MVIKATGAPGHGAKLYDNSAMENLLKSVEIVRRFRASQFDMIKAGLKAEGEAVSVNMAYLKAGTPSPNVSHSNLSDHVHDTHVILFMNIHYHPLANTQYIPWLGHVITGAPKGD